MILCFRKKPTFPLFYFLELLQFSFFFLIKLLNMVKEIGWLKFGLWMENKARSAEIVKTSDSPKKPSQQQQ